LTPSGVGIQNPTEDQEEEWFHFRRASLLVFDSLMGPTPALAPGRILKQKTYANHQTHVQKSNSKLSKSNRAATFLGIESKAGA
jgi:hypothetical protein